MCVCFSSVMILGVTILRKRYPLAKYLCVVLIVTGVALFLYKPNKGGATMDDHIFGFGEMLLVSGFSVYNLSLAFYKKGGGLHNYIRLTS